MIHYGHNFEEDLVIQSNVKETYPKVENGIVREEFIPKVVVWVKNGAMWGPAKDSFLQVLNEAMIRKEDEMVRNITVQENYGCGYFDSIYTVEYSEDLDDLTNLNIDLLLRFVVVKSGDRRIRWRVPKFFKTSSKYDIYVNVDEINQICIPSTSCFYFYINTKSNRKGTSEIFKHTRGRIYLTKDYKYDHLDMINFAHLINF